MDSDSEQPDHQRLHDSPDFMDDPEGDAALASELDLYDDFYNPQKDCQLFQDAAAYENSSMKISATTHAVGTLAYFDL